MNKQMVIAFLNEFIKSNGLQEITGSILNSALTAIANIIPDEAMLTSSFGGGIDEDSVEPANQTEPIWYFAKGGNYTNFGGYDLLSKNLNIIFFNGTTWQKVEVELPSDGLEAIDTTSGRAVNSIAVVDYAEPLSIFPFRNKPTTENQKVVASAIKELFIKDYDDNYNYYLINVVRSIDYEGYQENLYTIEVKKRHKTNLADVSSYEFSAYSHLEPNGDDFIVSNGAGNMIILIDWKQIPFGGGLDVAVSDALLLEEKIGELNSNPRINDFLKPEIPQSILSKTEANAIYYQKTESDSKYALIGSTTDSNYKFVDAADFGFLPNKTASENVIALQNALNGGNKTITISQPGIYDLNATVFVDDNTTIIFGNGAYLRKTAYYIYILLNRKAELRQCNYGVKVFNLKFYCNGFERRPETTSNLYGLHGHISFFYIKDLEIDGVECLDIGTDQYCVQICTWQDVKMKNMKIFGNKDGVHFGKGKNAKLSRGVFRTYDDSIAFNAFDWTAGNPEIGNIENVTIEDVADEFPNLSNMFRFLVGTVGKWTQNMLIREGDAVINDGKLYRALTSNFTGANFTSTVAPTIATFEGVQETTDGFSWKLIQKNIVGDFVTANILNVTVKNVTHEAVEGRFVSFEVDTEGVFSRTIHPSIQDANFPVIDVLFDSCKTSSGYFQYDEKIIFNLFLRNFKSGDYTFLKDKDNKLAFNGKILISESNLRNNTSPQILNGNIQMKMVGNFVAPTNGLMLSCKNGTSINTDGNILLFNPASGNYNDLTDLTAIKGDTLSIAGQRKIFNGSTWININ